MILPFLIALAAIPELIAFWLVLWLVCNLLADSRPVVMARVRSLDKEGR